METCRVRERSNPINLLEELRGQLKTAEFVYDDHSVVRLNLETIQSMDDLLHSLQIQPDAVRYYPLDRKPYIEFNNRMETDSNKIYINKVE